MKTRNILLETLVTETHLGTIRVPMDLHINKCLITRGTRDTGGTSQLFSPAQSKQKASTPSSQDSKNEKRIWEICGYGNGQNDLRNVDPKYCLQGGKIQTNTPVIKINDPGVKMPTSSPPEPSSYNIYCQEAAHVLLTMAHIMVNEVSLNT